MKQGLRIKINGNPEEIDIEVEDYNNDRLDKYTLNQGEGEYDYIEEFVVNNKLYLVFSWLRGNIFNNFDYLRQNVFGDIIIVAVNDNLDLIDVDIREINNYFCEDNLDDYEMQDSIDNLFIGNDEYESDFVVDDNFIEYCSDYDEEGDITMNWYNNETAS